MHPYMLRCQGAQKHFCRKGPGVPLQQRRTKASVVPLGKKHCQQGEGGDHFTLLGTGETCLECWVQVFASQYMRDVDKPKRVQQRAMKLAKGLMQLTYKYRLRDLWLFSLKERA